MSQATPTATNVNIGVSSTPIRIGSGSGSFHGQHGSSNSSATIGTAQRQHHHSHQGAGTGNESSSPGGSAVGQQSSSVPTTAVGQLQMQSNTSLAIGASNQSLGVLAGGAAGAGSANITPPNSAGIKQAGGLANWATDSRDKYDGNQTDKTPTDTSKLNRKESYKAQRKNYRREKKRVASELFNSLQDPAVIVLADWLKVRGTLKSWTKLWCVLKPGLLLIYKSPKTKSSHWVGTVLLTSCKLIERPSKKDGFCFKLFHPLEQSIWAPRGPDRETIGAVVQPLPTAYLIFRAPSQAAGKCWMDALELSLRCSALLLRSNSNTGNWQSTNVNDSGQISHETQWSEADYEKHFDEHDLDADSQNEGGNLPMSGAESGETDSDALEQDDRDLLCDGAKETRYVGLIEEEFNQHVGEQVEELAEENKSLIWILVKQVRPGMDLSKVVLPTFILEPRSFLDKLSDSYYHADKLSRAVEEDDPFTRMKMIVEWYLSGFYKKPKGLKKPYNPILGETFRCYWEHPNGSRTYYIAEQVSHHPPVSAFYVTNRQDGFCISCSILAKSKFYGNSTSAVLEGVATLTLLPRGESYTLTTPYAHCKGILMGTLSMELGGKINIDCENTGYKTELEFKLRPFLGGSDHTNLVVGKIKLGKETLASIQGHWDSEIFIKDTKSSEETLLFAANKETKMKRLVRHVVPLEAQLPTESEKLWLHVSDAIKREDQIAATEEKTVLEEAQRNGAKERKAMLTNWIPAHFQQDILTGQWIYKYADLRPWDPRNDVKQFECNYKVLTKTRHQAPLVRTTSVLSGDQMHVVVTDSIPMPVITAQRKVRNMIQAEQNVSDSSQSNDEVVLNAVTDKSLKRLATSLDQVNRTLEENSRQLRIIELKLERMEYAPPFTTWKNPTETDVAVSKLMRGLPSTVPQSSVVKAVAYGVISVICYVILKWFFK
ncbi:oxysterol-binding protein-related protein 8 isoform X1 [Teleopsis dalmanni]|uniref:oxysterol-binding protein-related protein 8 isoform X1 n=3 Tax=Teleopsis dalmanni TaxID=139649 RepID=UPI0018CE9F00|nr:oxysterol-binding protein-related protein 8 isoform X1 [Teleopsis dalmanni]